MSIEVFFSYAHEDEEFRDGLEKHLSILKRQGVISAWHDRRINAGTDWRGQISAHIDSASIILLMISSDFLSSDYCYDVEMKHALKRREAGEVHVIPVILRPCDWQGAPFGKLQPLPKDGKPVTEWRSRDRAFTDIIKGIRAIIHVSNKPGEFNAFFPSAVITDLEEAAADSGDANNLEANGKEPTQKIERLINNAQTQDSGFRKAFKRFVRNSLVPLIIAVIAGIVVFHYQRLFESSKPIKPSIPQESKLPSISERMQRFIALKNTTMLVDSLNWYQNRGFLTYDSDRRVFVNPNRLYIFATKFGEVEEVFYLLDSKYFSLTKKAVLDELSNEIVNSKAYWVKEHE